MSADVRVIKLCREMLLENEAEPNCVEKNENIKYYFATDYFDSLVVEEKKLEDTFASIMHFGQDKGESGRAVSVQSYTLYFSDDMERRYEKDTAPMRGNPFAANLDYLSIVQVHITPEILRRMKYEEDLYWWKEKKQIILEPFVDDLYEIIDDFQRENSQEKFVYRVYQVMSAGDFAVVIKSRYPETSFAISSCIRRRVAGIGEEDGSQKWAIYKTYTLLTMEREISKETKGAAESRGWSKFVIRGCYSSHYWASLGETVQEMQARYNVSKWLCGLNGRYDFSVELQEKEFFQIFEHIVRYKGKYTETDQSDADMEENSLPKKVCYLKYLLENHYLSCINERYLVSGDRKAPGNGMKQTFSRTVLIDEERKNIRQLYDFNEESISSLLETYDEVEKRIQCIEQIHKNMEQYLRLLKKQIRSCQEINQLSDTRVYACGLEQLLKTILDSLEIYLQIYGEVCAKDEIAELLVEYLREAVHAMDSYTEYIRNNNLQSLQTPNYNIESNMGMEKILIGYSEYLKQFMDYYRQEKMCTGKSFLPVVIPDLHRTDMCVEVLFPEGNADKWKREGEIRDGENEAEQKRRYLLVVDSPTLAELGDVPVFMSMLFHEMAHQFCYESRRERNRVLFHSVVREGARRVAVETAKGICAFDEEDMELKLSEILGDSLAEALILRMEESVEEWMDTSMYYFNRKLFERLREFSTEWSFRDVWEAGVRQFIKEVQAMGNPCSYETEKCLVRLIDAMNMDAEADSEGKKVRDLKKIIKSAFVLAWLCAYGLLSEEEKKRVGRGIWEEKGMRIEEWCSDGRELEDSVQWDRLQIAEKKRDVQAIWYSYFLFEQTMTDGFRTEKASAKNRVSFFEEVYKIACEKWSVKNREIISGFTKSAGECFDGNSMSMTYRAWALTGRYLGIDNESRDNQKKFFEILARAGSMSGLLLGHGLIEKYREITSDIFVCCTMGLSPFGYLNLVSLIIPEAELYYKFNMERITTVLYVTNYSKDWNIENAISNYNGVCRKILAEIKQYVLELLQEGAAKERIVSGFEDAESRWDKEIELQKYVYFADLHRVLKEEEEGEEKKEKEKEKKEEESGREVQKLRHLRKLMRVLENVQFKGAFYVRLLEEDCELKEDYLRGVEEIRKVRAKSDSTNVKVVGEMVRLGEKNAEYLKRKHYRTGTVEDAELNSMSIETLLRLYYIRKIRNARKDALGEHKKHEN